MRLRILGFANCRARTYDGFAAEVAGISLLISKKWRTEERFRRLGRNLVKNNAMTNETNYAKHVPEPRGMFSSEKGRKTVEHVGPRAVTR